MYSMDNVQFANIRAGGTYSYQSISKRAVHIVTSHCQNGRGIRQSYQYVNVRRGSKYVCS
jgi:hypothetical protein